MQVNIEEAPPAKPEIKSVTLTLTPEEAQALSMFAGCYSKSELRRAIEDSYFLDDGKRAAVSTDKAADIFQQFYFTLSSHGIDGRKDNG